MNEDGSKGKVAMAAVGAGLGFSPPEATVEYEVRRARIEAFGAREVAAEDVTIRGVSMRVGPDEASVRLSRGDSRYVGDSCLLWP